MNEVSKFKTFLRKISLGKYHTKLYYGDRTGEYSTVTGGIITVSIGLLLIVVSLNILIQTFKRASYTTNTSYNDLVDSNDNLATRLTMKDFRSTLLDFRYVIPQNSQSKRGCQTRNATFLSFKGSMDLNFTNPYAGNFSFEEVKTHEGLEALGIGKFCIFNQPGIPDYNLTWGPYKKYLDSINDFKAINLTSSAVNQESLGPGSFKTLTYLTNLEESDYIFLLMPAQLFSSDAKIKPKSYTQTTHLDAGIIKVIRPQIMRVRTTDTIWGFSIAGGKLGDFYTETISINYLVDETRLKLDAFGGPNSITGVQAMFSPQIVDIVRQPSTSLLSAIAKIGGLMALMKFAIILNLWHQSLFTKKMKDKMNENLKENYALNETLNNNEQQQTLLHDKITQEEGGEETNDFRDQFSFENLSKELAQIKIQREMIDSQKKQIDRQTKQIESLEKLVQKLIDQ